jgi:glycosyltransferase involved in cell wall biosynthesis
MNKVKNIYLIDIIGIHSGMKYYDDAFIKELSTIKDIKIHILSNYANDPSLSSFFPQFFINSKLKGILQVLYAYISLLWLMFCKKKSHFIYLSYGGYIDILFMTLTFFFKKITIDIHDIYALDYSNNRIIKRAFGLLYCNAVRSVIVHSDYSKELLQELRYQKKMFEMPHFKYCFNKDYLEKNCSMDAIAAIKVDCINILFFGYMRLSKGIDVLSEAYSTLPIDIQDKIHLIIAGNDPHNILSTLPINNNKNVSILKRYINDDELIYLFSKVNYVILPYRKVSQSGILEMAFYFRKPILASRISYFEQIINNYPSFGRLFNNNVEDLANVMFMLPTFIQEFYNANDIKNFEQRNEIDNFLYKFPIYINSI